MNEDDFLKFLNSYIAKTDIILSLYKRSPTSFSSDKLIDTQLIRETALYILDNYKNMNKEDLKEIISDFDYPVSKWI